jgi:hypothetical protein
MSLHVNLLLESERRSGRILNPKLVLRITIIALPLFAAATVLSGVGKAMMQARELRQLEAAWQRAEPQKKEAERLSGETANDRRIAEEISGWRTSRIEWHQQMESIRTAVPASIQLVSLTMEQTLDCGDDQKPRRACTMSLRGKASGTESEEAVKSLQAGIQRAETSTGTVEQVRVASYGADTGANAGTNDYVFQLDCVYRIRGFE